MDSTRRLAEAHQSGVQEQIEDVSSRELLHRTVRAARQLAQVEIELAKDELRAQMKVMALTAFWAAVAFGTLILALASIVVAISLGSWGSQVAVVTAVASGVVAVLAAVIAFEMTPRRWLERTRERLKREATELRKLVT